MRSLFLLLGTFPSEMLLFLSEMTNYLPLFPRSSFLFLPPFCSLSTLSHTLSLPIPNSPFLSFIFLLPGPSARLPQASKIDSLRSKVDLLRLPLALSSKSISSRKSQLGVVWEKGGGGSGVGGARKPRPPPASDMDNESTYSGYSYKSSHSRSSRKHR